MKFEEVISIASEINDKINNAQLSITKIELKIYNLLDLKKMNNDNYCKVINLIAEHYHLLKITFEDFGYYNNFHNRALEMIKEDKSKSIPYSSKSFEYIETEILTQKLYDKIISG